MIKVLFVCFDWAHCFIYVVWIGCKAVLFGRDIDGWSQLFVYVSEHTSLTNHSALYSCCRGLCAWEIPSRPESWHFYFFQFRPRSATPPVWSVLVSPLAQPWTLVPPIKYNWVLGKHTKHSHSSWPSKFLVAYESPLRKNLGSYIIHINT